MVPPDWQHMGEQSPHRWRKFAQHVAHQGAQNHAIPSRLYQNSAQGLLPHRARHGCHTVGQVLLDITFGIEDNFRIEKIMLDIINFEMAYNAIL